VGEELERSGVQKKIGKRDRAEKRMSHSVVGPFWEKRKTEVKTEKAGEWRGQLKKGEGKTE